MTISRIVFLKAQHNCTAPRSAHALRQSVPLPSLVLTGSIRVMKRVGSIRRNHLRRSHGLLELGLRGGHGLAAVAVEVGFAHAVGGVLPLYRAAVHLVVRRSLVVVVVIV